MKFYDEEQMAEVREALEKEILRWPKVAAKEMMGCLCYFRGKKFFAFLVTKGIVVTKLSEKSRAELTQEMGGKAFEMSGRVAKTWIKVPLRRARDVRLVLSFVKESYRAAK
jgi:hypothetical protein